MSDVVIDTSALVAIAWREPAADWILAQLKAASVRLLAAPSFVELGLVLESKAPGAVGSTRRMVREFGLQVVPFDQGLGERAIDAFHRFGKGRHPAGLNLGDCFTYALAEETGLPILCVGEDFAQTDLPVLRPE